MPDIHRDRPNTEIVWPGGPSRQGPHRVGSFAICPQLEAFAHERHLRLAVERDATAIGTLLHVGLAYRYGLMLAEKPSWLVYPSPAEAIQICGTYRPDAANEALRIFLAYEAWYKQNLWQPVLVEHQFEVSMEDEPYTARIDLLVIDSSEYALVDHKSMQRLNRSVGTDYRADRQMLTGLALCRAHGYDVKRVIINACTKEYPTPRFERYEVPISEEAYARLGADTRYYLQRMKEVRAAYPDPMNRPRNWDACVRKYGRCDYYPICTEGLVRLGDYKEKGAG